jgi:hypothetical protein
MERDLLHLRSLAIGSSAAPVARGRHGPALGHAMATTPRPRRPSHPKVPEGAVNSQGWVRELLGYGWDSGLRMFQVSKILEMHFRVSRFCKSRNSRILAIIRYY